MKTEKPARRAVLAGCAVAIVLAASVLWPAIDLRVAGWFYVPDKGFPLGDTYFFDALHTLAYAGARILGLALAMLVIFAASQRAPVLGLGSKEWLFLFVGLIIGPGLIANGLLKDHWGRARPREVTEFGGNMEFSRALLPSEECQHNCSFVSGDGAFGFYLPAFAYVLPRPRARRTFWGAMGVGCLFAVSRIAAGAHFLSDNLFAAFFMQAVLALLHAVMFGARETRNCWRNWLFIADKSTD